MSNKFITISICTIIASFASGWGMAILNNEYKNSSHLSQAIPVIRFEYFDGQRDVLMIGLFNPGSLSMEINRAELSFQRNDMLPGIVFSDQEYGEKPLVLDPDDTILIPLQKKQALMFQAGKGSYWAELSFQIPGQVDFFSLHHRVSKNHLNGTGNIINK